ncbi:MAG: phasin family protein [Pseudomonadota bacterium]
MSDDKSNVADKASEIAKNIWLAGVGAYGRAVDEAQDRLEKAGVETPKLFKDLVKAGAALEDEARETLSTSAARSSVEERINRVRENFNLQRPARGEDLLALHEKIDLLSRKVDVLASALTEAGLIDAPPTPARAAKRAKKSPTPRKKAARKKTPAKKAPGKKAPGKKPANKRAAGSRKSGA